MFWRVYCYSFLFVCSIVQLFTSKFCIAFFVLNSGQIFVRWFRWCCAALWGCARFWSLKKRYFTLFESFRDFKIWTSSVSSLLASSLLLLAIAIHIGWVGRRRLTTGIEPLVTGWIHWFGLLNYVRGNCNELFFLILNFWVCS